MIIVRDLSKSFGNEKVLSHINLEIGDGDIFGLVGRSGVGKSTLLRCINALETYDSGSLTVNGQEVKDLRGMELRKFRRSVGMIFQQFSLTERDTVYDNVVLPMKCWKYSKEEIAEKSERLLKIVELDDRKNQKTRSLSGGQKQRVAIARALTLDPSILLCDEATSALDPKTTLSILELLKKVNQEMGVTVVVVTHEMSVVRSICTRLAVLDRGGVADTGTVEKVFRDRCPALEDLLGVREQHFEACGDGRILRIFYKNEEISGNLFGHLARDIGVLAEILSASQEEYETGVFGEYYVRIREEEFSPVTQYLDNHGIFWEAVR